MILLLTSLCLFILLGIPVAYALGLSALAYFVIAHPELIAILPQHFYAGTNSTR